MSARGFDTSEFEARTARAQAGLARLNAAALLLTTEADIRYFTGFLTRFFESPTRPWFLIVPINGAPIAVIPAIGENLMRRTWISDIRTWSAPQPPADGLPLLSDTLAGLCPASGRIATPMGIETHLHMPLDQLDGLRDRLGARSIVSDEGLTRGLRAVMGAHRDEAGTSGHESCRY